jgi:hypothetical protein
MPSFRRDRNTRSGFFLLPNARLRRRHQVEKLPGEAWPSAIAISKSMTRVFVVVVSGDAFGFVLKLDPY